jgi:hypothetical protein
LHFLQSDFRRFLSISPVGKYPVRKAWRPFANPEKGPAAWQGFAVCQVAQKRKASHRPSPATGSCYLRQTSRQCAAH